MVNKDWNFFNFFEQLLKNSIENFITWIFYLMRPYSPNSKIIITTYLWIYLNIKQIYTKVYYNCEKKGHHSFVLRNNLKIFLLFVCHCVVLYSSLTALSSTCILTYKFFSLFCFYEPHVILLPLTLFCFVHLCFKI